jgi:uncharacterized repeat protein (TIGR02543 family)
MKRFLSVFLVVIIILSAASCDLIQSTTIQFETFGGTLIDDQILLQRSTITKPQTPIKDGFAFIGWYSNNTLWDFNEVVNDDITLYAKWRVISYKLEHYQQDVNGTDYMLFATENLTGNTDASVTAEAAEYTGFQENTGYTSRIPTGTILGDGSLVLKLYYDRITFTVSYNSNEGSAVSPISSMRYGATITTPAAPTKTGYTFSGWFKEAGLTTVWDFAHDTVTKNSTLYAKWAPSTVAAYKLEHYQQDVSGTGYTLFATEDLTGVIDATATAKAAAYLRYQENTGHTLRIPSGTILSDGSLVLKLYYDRNTYTVSYNSTDGSAVSSDSSVRYGAKITEPAAPTKPGYIFSDWWIEFFVAWDFDTDTVTADKTLYAKWEPSTDTAYKLEHYQQDVSGTGYTLVSTENLTGTTESTVIAVTASSSGFEENTSHASSVLYGTILGDGSLVLKLYYDRITYTISYNSIEGSAVSPETSVRYGAGITAPTEPTKPGYIFSDWFKEAGLSTTWDFIHDMVTKNSTLYAKWEPSTDTTYKLEHYQQDVSGTGYTLFATENLTGTTEGNVIAVAASYSGFEENTDHDSRILKGTILGNGSLVLELYYDRNTYTVSYNSNEGTDISPVSSVRYGAGITAPAAPSKSDYPFFGWFKEAELTTAWDFTADTVTADITLYAKWAPFKTRIINTKELLINN